MDSSSRAMSSVDDWNEHWDRYAESARYNPAQAYRRKLIYSFLDFSSRQGPLRVLDVGSGQGDFALELKQFCPKAEVLGIELSRSGVEISKRKVPDGMFIEQDLSQYREPPESYRGWATHVVCSEVLEHTDEPQKILNHIRPYLAPGCQVIVTVPGGPMSYFDKYIGHRKHYRVSELHNLLGSSDFNIKFISGAGFPFFNLYRLVVVARGKALVQDVVQSESQAQGMSNLAKFVMWIFSILFRFNVKSSSLGWQMIAVAVLDESRAKEAP